MRTRMPGGVAGAQPVTAAPYADCFRRDAIVGRGLCTAGAVGDMLSAVQASAVAVGDMLLVVEALESRLVTCCRPLSRLVPPCWAGHFLAERQKVTKKRVA
ncbi:exported hypothetical protein [Cupriavidus oxalaticus]|uniref:Uncharacterized protein n=1 Tax=Cupriavidus oxalaticus TaxID=96344 RepID=A0A976BF41_9BURK|nr:exported hypothetical protein [Cupriavidus oxalaticus]